MCLLQSFGMLNAPPEGDFQHTWLSWSSSLLGFCVLADTYIAYVGSVSVQWNIGNGLGRVFSLQIEGDRGSTAEPFTVRPSPFGMQLSSLLWAGRKSLVFPLADLWRQKWKMKREIVFSIVLKNIWLVHKTRLWILRKNGFQSLRGGLLKCWVPHSLSWFIRLRFSYLVQNFVYIQCDLSTSFTQS